MKPHISELFEKGISGKEFSCLLNVSPRRISQLAAEGYLEKLGRDRYVPCIANYADLRAAAAAKARGGSAQTEIVDREKARRLRRINDVAERVLIPIDETLDALAAILGPVQAELATIPVHATDDPRIRFKIEATIDVIMNNLAARFAAHAKGS